MSGHSDDDPSERIGEYICYRGMPVHKLAKQWNRSWPADDNGNLILVSIPSTVNLSNFGEQTGLYGGKRNIANLPTEIHWTILDFLLPVDRVCLGLTCKKLAASVVRSPRLHSAVWASFIDCGYRFMIPESYHLIQRLAHGWLDKKKFRYCWKCRKILPRDEKFFEERLQFKKVPTWNVKTGMPKEDWQRLSKKKKYQHMIKLWCEADWEDSSCYACSECRAGYIDACRTRLLKCVAHSPPLLLYQPPVHQAAQCPTCLEAELTFTWKRPRKGLFRPFLWKVLNILWNIVSSIFLIIIYLIIILVQSPWKLGKKAWIKWHWGQKLRRLKWWKR